MGEKITLALAAILLMLSGCAAQPAAPPSASPLKKAPEVSGAPPSVEVFLPKGALPDGSYKAQSLPARYYEDITTTLIPRGDYGRIWPYIGAYIKKSWHNSEFYGLCDENGRIICDPVYHEVNLLEKDGVKLYELIRYEKIDKIRKNSKITLARPDGSWAGEYDEIITHISAREYPPYKEPEKPMPFDWRKDITNEYITVRRGEKWGAIDYSGNEILPCVYRAPLYFSEGLACALSDDDKEVYFIDSSGKKVLGPYQTPQQLDNSYVDFEEPLPLNYGLVFYEGRTRFYKDGKYGVIDKSGKVLAEPRYDYISSYFKGTAKYLSGGKDGLLGPNGEVLPEASRESPKQTGEQKALSYNEDEKYILDKNSLRLKVKDGERYFPGVKKVYDLSNGNYLLDISSNNRSWKIIDSEGADVAGPFEGHVEKITSGMIFVHTGEPCILGEYEYWVKLYDETGKLLIPDRYLFIKPFDSRYLVRTEIFSGLMNPGGKWVIKVPLYEYMND